MNKETFKRSAIQWIEALGFGSVSLEDHLRVVREEYNELYNAGTEANKKQETADLIWVASILEKLCDLYGQEPHKLIDLSYWMAEEEGIYSEEYANAVSQANWAKLLPCKNFSMAEANNQVQRLAVEKPEKYKGAKAVKVGEWITIRSDKGKILKPLGWKDYTSYL